MHRMLHQVLLGDSANRYIYCTDTIISSFNLKNNNHYDILQEMRRNAATGNEILYEVGTPY